MSEQPVPFNPVIVAPDGRPARDPRDERCPDCGSGPDKRVLSGGFGAPWEVCRVCGHEWREGQTS